MLLLSPILELSAETKIQVRTYFSVGREGFTKAQSSGEVISWFARDVTKNQTKKLSILLSFYFHEVLQYLNIFT